MGIEVNKGVLLCGNTSTPNLLVAEFQHMSGTFGIVPVCINNYLVDAPLYDHI